MAGTIDEWWPRLDEQIRFWAVNNLFSPLAQFTLGEIERVGGPAADDQYWKQGTDGSRSLPAEAIRWITRCDDFSALSRPHEPDPRANRRSPSRAGRRLRCVRAR